MPVSSKFIVVRSAQENVVIRPPVQLIVAIFTVQVVIAILTVQNVHVVRGSSLHAIVAIIRIHCVWTGLPEDGIPLTSAINRIRSSSSVHNA
jgi:hypothetical protein